MWLLLSINTIHFSSSASHIFNHFAAADILLWRDWTVSAGVLGISTAIWVLLELIEYHLLTLVCHILILGLTISFLWSTASKFINKCPPKIRKYVLPEDIVLSMVSEFRIELNKILAILRETASGRDLMKFLAVISGLWFVSFLGSCFNFLSLLYLCIVLLHSVPVAYEKYEDQIDAFAEKTAAGVKKQYAIFYAKFLRIFKDKKLL